MKTRSIELPLVEPGGELGPRHVGHRPRRGQLLGRRTTAATLGVQPSGIGPFGEFRRCRRRRCLAPGELLRARRARTSCRTPPLPCAGSGARGPRRQRRLERQVTIETEARAPGRDGGPGCAAPARRVASGRPHPLQRSPRRRAGLRSEWFDARRHVSFGTGAGRSAEVRMPGGRRTPRRPRTAGWAVEARGRRAELSMVTGKAMSTFAACRPRRTHTPSRLPESQSAVDRAVGSVPRGAEHRARDVARQPPRWCAGRRCSPPRCRRPRSIDRPGRHRDLGPGLDAVNGIPTRSPRLERGRSSCAMCSARPA